jgi:predicted dehydrogenase/nucleoside-diphosphate-sugar epimerase
VAGARQSAAVAGGDDLASVLQTRPRMTPLRIAFVGAGRMARQHLRALRRVRTPHVIGAICDTSESAARELAAPHGASAYSSLADLLREVKPDIVHVCTPAGTHFEPARLALLGGAHIYVEKPFVESEREAAELLTLARERGLRVCAGHQQVRDPAFIALRARLAELRPVTHVDSHFTFRPVGLNPERAGPKALGAQLLDILPHPLYTLIAALEAAMTDPMAIELAAVIAGPADLQAVFRANEIYGRLSVSLRSRPVASTLCVAGGGGALTADFIRTSVVGAANPGTGPLEKAANPLLEGWQTAAGGVAGVVRRVLHGGDYPGLAELIGEFCGAVAGGGASPLPPDHVQRVTAVYEELAANVRGAVARAAIQREAPREPSAGAPLAVVTGARGFFGKEITRALGRRGFRVRGISRSPDEGDPYVQEWRALDLSRPVPADAFAGARVVVHAAVDTAGGYDGHQRNTIDATRNVLRAMQTAGVSRLVYVSSLSVLQPPGSPWDVQDERTPLAPPGARQYGAYAWGKTEAERLVLSEAAAHSVDARILRPGALVDWAAPDVPGLVGRRLFGRWHLGFGRPGLPFAVCEVGRAAAVVAWSAAEFEAAPQVVHLLDPAIPTRRRLLALFRAAGWRGRMLWFPIPLFAGCVAALRLVIGVATLHLPSRLSVWSIFRPRRYNVALATRVLAAIDEPVPADRALTAQLQQ